MQNIFDYASPLYSTTTGRYICADNNITKQIELLFFVCSCLNIGFISSQAGYGKSMSVKFSDVPRKIMIELTSGQLSFG